MNRHRHRSTFVRTFGMAALVLGVVVALGLPVAAHDPTVVLSHFGTARIDGVLSPGEWQGAKIVSFVAKLETGGTTTGTLFAMNDSNNLYLAAQVFRTSLGSSSVTFEFDNDHDAIWPEDGDDVLVLSPDLGALSDVFRAGGIAPLDINFGGTNDGAGMATNNGPRFRGPRGEIGATSGLDAEYLRRLACLAEARAAKRDERRLEPATRLERVTC